MKAGGHGKNFGTMLQAVNRRALVLLGLLGDPEPYPCHDYALDDGLRPGPKQSLPHIHPPPRNQSRPATSPMSRQELYDAAFRHVTQNSGTDYDCTESDLEATGGLTRRQYPENDPKDREASRQEWFSRPNHGQSLTPRQASLDIFEHNDLRREPHKSESGPIERLSKAINAGRHGYWSPDLIIKAFCDLDIVFFGGKLRDHVCVRWLPYPEKRLGETVYLGEGKCAIRLNADTILLNHPRPFERMFATMLHEMW